MGDKGYRIREVWGAELCFSGYQSFAGLGEDLSCASASLRAFRFGVSRIFGLAARVWKIRFHFGRSNWEFAFGRLRRRTSRVLKGLENTVFMGGGKLQFCSR